MKKWEYYELIAQHYNAFLSIVEQGSSIEMAIHRTYEDFYFYPESENVIENFISTILCINLQISLLKKVHKAYFDFFSQQLPLIKEEILMRELKCKEIEHLKELIEEISINLKTTAIYG